MRYKGIFNRLTGISCPIFGISWNPPESQRSIARKIIIYLESKRILYSSYEYETVNPCISSVVEMKKFFTSELSSIKDKSRLQNYVRAMRDACNKFLSKCQDSDDFRYNACKDGNIYNWIFVSAIGEMRGIFGIMVGQISSAYGIDVDDNLTQIIP